MPYFNLGYNKDGYCTKNIQRVHTSAKAHITINCVNSMQCLSGQDTVKYYENLGDLISLGSKVDQYTCYNFIRMAKQWYLQIATNKQTK